MNKMRNNMSRFQQKIIYIQICNKYMTWLSNCFSFNKETIHISIERAQRIRYEHKSNNQTQVIKSVFHSHFEEDPSGVHVRECQDLSNEWKILNSLNHHYIIKPFQFIQNHKLQTRGGQLQGCSLYLESAFCDLYTLVKNNDQQLRLKTIMKYFKQVALALEYLHNQEIAHNDVKLENMLVMSRELVKLADFGFAYRPPQDLVVKWLPRTLNHYTSPEIANFRFLLAENVAAQFDPDEFSLFSSDVFALAMSLFIAIYKRPPLQGHVPSREDPYYRLLLDDPDHFWNLEFIQKIDAQLMREHVPRIVLENLKDLLEGGLSEEPNRLTIDEFLNHEFFDLGQQLEEEKA